MTAQTCDHLCYSGLTLALADEPLWPWLQSRKHRKLYHFVRRSTANWRGYHGYWELRDGKLYLTKLSGRLRVFKENEWVDNTQDPLDELFPGHDGPVFASWFSGVLRCHVGNLLRYVHMGYSSVFEFDLFFQIKQGRQYMMWMKRNELPEENDDFDLFDFDGPDEKWDSTVVPLEPKAQGFKGLLAFEQSLVIANDDRPA